MGKERTQEERLRLYEKYRDRIERLTLMDDEFMGAVFADDIEATELVLRIILGMELKVVSVKAQRQIANLKGRSVRLDIFAEDSGGRKYDVEIQRASKGAGAKRARFYASMLDADALVKSEDFESLPETYVVFITESDVLGGGKPVYEIERVVTNTGVRFGDGLHIVYVNGENDGNDTELGRLMHDFKCSVPDDMNYGILRDRARRCKEATEVKNMSDIFEEFKEEVKMENAVETARTALEMKLSVEQIQKLTGFSEEKILEIQKELEMVTA